MYRGVDAMVVGGKWSPYVKVALGIRNAFGGERETGSACLRQTPVIACSPNI